MKRILTPLTAAVLALSLAACGSDSDEAPETTSSLTVVNAGKLTVCSDVPYAPFEIEDASAPSGFSGFDVDIVQFVADELDLELNIVPTAFGPIQSGAALNAGQCDLGASAITINDERKPNLDFSDPYFESEQSLLVPTGSDIESIADLDGRKVGVQDATTGQEFANENAEGADVVAFADDGKMFLALKAESVDALLQDIGVNALHQSTGDFTIVETFPTDEVYGLAMKKGNTEMVEAVNAALTTMRDAGTYDEIFAKYFG